MQCAQQFSYKVMLWHTVEGHAKNALNGKMSVQCDCDNLYHEYKLESQARLGDTVKTTGWESSERKAGGGDGGGGVSGEGSDGAEATYMTNDLALVHDVHLPTAKNDAFRLECILHLHTHIAHEARPKLSCPLLEL